MELKIITLFLISILLYQNINAAFEVNYEIKKKHGKRYLNLRDVQTRSTLHQKIKRQLKITTKNSNKKRRKLLRTAEDCDNVETQIIENILNASDNVTKPLEPTLDAAIDGITYISNNAKSIIHQPSQAIDEFFFKNKKLIIPGVVGGLGLGYMNGKDNINEFYRLKAQIEDFNIVKDQEEELDKRVKELLDWALNDLEKTEAKSIAIVENVKGRLDEEQKHMKDVFDAQDNILKTFLNREAMKEKAEKMISRAFNGYN